MTIACAILMGLLPCGASPSRLDAALRNGGRHSADREGFAMDTLRADIHRIADTSLGQWHQVGLTDQDREAHLDRALDVLLGLEVEYIPVYDFLEQACERMYPPPFLPLVNAIRAEVIERDGLICQECGIETIRGERGRAGMTIDHIVPVVGGGSDRADNLQVLCRSCNARKGAKQ